MFKFLVAVALTCSSFVFAGTSQTYVNKNGTIIGRSYTNNNVTVYRNSRGNIVGYSKPTYQGGTKIIDKSGVYNGLIINGFVKDSNGKSVGQVKTQGKK